VVLRVLRDGAFIAVCGGMVNRPFVCLAFLTLASLASLAPVASADPSTAPDKTESPYFVVEGARSGVEALPLESTNAEVHIAGVIADVKVTQTYKNDGDQTISAHYVFPASTRAAVYGMKMTIGDRVIVAKIKEREAARAEYEQAKTEGKTASLLEQDRPNVFSMNVANILPKDRIQVELEYTELLVPTEGVYELVYPTIVGPRYVSGGTDSTDATNKFLATPYTHAGVAPKSTFGLHVTMAAGMPIQAIESPSHKIAKQLALGGDRASIDLDDPAGGNRDFILHYRLSGDDLGTGLLLYPGAKENFFLAMVQPPARPAVAEIPAREYVFIVDVSGSMNGFPLDVTKKLMQQLLSRLRSTDKFDIEMFSGGSDLFAEHSVPATATNIKAGIEFMNGQAAGGGTELRPALERAMQIEPSPNTSRTFIVVTDGFISEEAAMFDTVRSHLGEANVFAFGIGSSVNRHLIEGIAKAGQGEAFVVEGEKTAEEVAGRFRAYVETPVLTKVNVAFDGLDAYDVSPVRAPDVFAQRPVVVFGKYRGDAKGKITVTGVTGKGRFVATLDAATTKADPSNKALQYLWARTKIGELSDFVSGDEHKADVVALGLQYNLLTRYTSFIAVQQLVRATGSTDVVQPQPMPAGVSDDAIGMEVGPEPELMLLVGLVLFACGFRLVRRGRLA
jgi:Ca-activated chloride channel family protein